MSLTKASYSMLNGAVANILDYGADPTGVDDSTTAITAAIAASGCVYIPQGVFKISALSVNKSNFYMFGCGDASVLQTTPEANVAISIGNVLNTENITLRQFKIQGNPANLGGIQVGTESKYVAFALFDELTIRGFDNSSNSYGLRLRSAQELEVRNCRLLWNYYGVYRANEGYVTSTLFCGKKSYCGLGGVGFYFNGAVDDLTIRDYIVEGNSSEGILSDFYPSNLTISDCYFEQNCSDGSGNGHVYISGNAVTPYQYTNATIERCAFHVMTAGSFPNVKLDKTRALLTGNSSLLSVNTGVTTTANTSATFIQNKSQGADNPVAIYRTYLGNISAIDTDEHGIQFVLAKQMVYKPQTPSLAQDNCTYVSTVDGKLYFRDSGGIDRALY